ncbi:hypothetical protein ONZ51_g4158 [Trametes cubensis]|uniref:holo-[acyl-carrier-protein] synthase n=1 Tax=Trametes cubensis TaxID=1111947 RepID=A0AAD7TXF9_9APHY|nr:hypothetical protein ONZ51_g4158 [Trametes cubensis]
MNFSQLIGVESQLYQRGLLRVDEEARLHLQKYYHRIDSVRGLIGRLLPRALLKKRGVPIDAVTFSKTEAGKPYIRTQLDTPVGYNITHDNGVVAMVYSIGADLYPDPPAYRVGVDVMLLQLPKRDTFPGFVEIFSDQLTPLERSILLPPAPAPALDKDEALRRFFLVWTLKEAYTKALGLGMGFDFSRIEYDVPNDVVRIDGKIPYGWEFTRFDLRNVVHQDLTEDYVGVVARYVGDTSSGKVQYVPSPKWLKVWEAKEFLTFAIEELGG